MWRGSGEGLERVWPPCPGARSTSSIESLALLAAGLVMPIACYPADHVQHSCIISVHVCMHNNNYVLLFSSLMIFLLSLLLAYLPLPAY